MIRAKIFPGALYSAEAAELPDKEVAKLCAVILHTITGTESRHDADKSFATCSAGEDLDPVGQILLRSCTGFRRAIGKRPHLLKRYQAVHEAYLAKGMSGTTMNTDFDAQDTGELIYACPAPHPTNTRSSRAPWKRVSSRLGQ